MKVEYGIMSNKWSVEADDKLVFYATILIHISSNWYNMVILYNDECKDDQWAFCDNIDKRLNENFGIDYFDVEDFKQYVELNKCNTKL